MNPYLWNYQAEPERLAEMDQECFPIPWKFDSYLELSQQKIFQAGELVHPENGSCGFLVFYLIPPEIQILRMGVLPENRREGLALEMLKELDQKAILNQSHTLWLDVHVENTPALGLYQKSGYKEIYRRKGYYQNPPGDAVLMKKTLQEAAVASTDEDERDGRTKAAATIKHAAKANT